MGTSPIKILVSFNIDFLPVEASVVELMRSLARSLLLGLYMALAELEAILRLRR